jgi:hypothetical protein
MNQHLLVKMPERRSDEGREQDAISFANLGKAQNTRSA